MKIYRVYVLKLTLFSHEVHYKTPPLFTISMQHLQCNWSLVVVHFWEWYRSLKCEKIAKQKKGMWFTLIYVAVYLPLSMRCTLFVKNVEQKTTKTCVRKFTYNKTNHEVHLPFSCSAFFSLKQCILLSDEVHTSILVLVWEKIRLRKETMKFTWPSNAVRFSI